MMGESWTFLPPCGYGRIPLCSLWARSAERHTGLTKTLLKILYRVILKGSCGQLDKLYPLAPVPLSNGALCVYRHREERRFSWCATFPADRLIAIQNPSRDCSERGFFLCPVFADISCPVQSVTVRYDSTGYTSIWRGAGNGDGLSSRLPVQDWNDRETGEPMNRVVRNPFQGQGAGGEVGSHTKGISFQCPCCRTLQIQKNG